MITARALFITLAVSLSLSAAQASDLEQTGSINQPADVEVVKAPPPSEAPAATTANEKTASVVLPELHVTTVTPVPRSLPPLKPLPKWDPHVCIGC